MSQEHDSIAILYEFAIELDQRGYDVAVLEEWIARYPSAAEELMDFFVDEVRTEEMQSEGQRIVPTPSLDSIKNSGISQLQLRLVRRGNAASKRA